jgi:EAL domain-containing protein (putative c-di-GMP-specific phosphodiesterase class I)
MMVDPDGAQDVLRELRTMGVGVSLDDFGTGYTSMIQLQTLPVTTLKIDRAFVTGMLASRDDSAVTELLIALGARLGLVVVAEGVETGHVLERLRALGCDQAQGYHVARPLAARDVPARVRAQALSADPSTWYSSSAMPSPVKA